MVPPDIGASAAPGGARRLHDNKPYFRARPLRNTNRYKRVCKRHLRGSRMGGSPTCTRLVAATGADRQLRMPRGAVARGPVPKRGSAAPASAIRDRVTGYRERATDTTGRQSARPVPKRDSAATASANRDRATARCEWDRAPRYQRRPTHPARKRARPRRDGLFRLTCDAGESSHADLYADQRRGA